MKKGLFNKRIPTVLALGILIFIIGISTFLIQQGIFYVGKAAPDTQPQNFSITNVTSTSFTAVFTTSGLADAVLNINDAKIGNSITLDDRDKKTGVQNKYYSHHITVQNLSPLTTYLFKLIVGGKEYTNSLYSVKTGAQITGDPPKQNPIFGKILLPDGTPGTDSIVIARTDASGAISAITDTKGEFIIPTNSVRDLQSTQYFTLQNDTVFSISTFRQTMNANARATFSVAQNLPPITLLQQYVFTSNNEQIATASSELNFSLPNSTGNSLSITVPTNNEAFTDLRPLFKGTSSPNSTVTISVKKLFNKEVLAGADGSWSFRIDTDFPPGRYTLSVASSDSNGVQNSASKTFAILPQGSQILAQQLGPTTTPTPYPTATPTITPTPTNKPTPTQGSISPSPTLTTSPAPTIQITDTITPTVAPAETATPTIIPTVFVTPTNIPPIAKPGGIENSVLLTGLSVFLIVAGTALLFAL